MGSVWKLRFWVATILCEFSSFGFTLPVDPDEGFQFNCGQSLCSFPYQYCETDDFRCLYCKDDFCHSKDQLPDQCRTYCKDKYHSSSTPDPDNGKLRNVTDTGGETMSDHVQIALWAIVSILFVILILIIAMIIHYCSSKAKQRNNGRFICSPADEENQHNTCHNECEQMTLIDRKDSHDSGNSSTKSLLISTSPTPNNTFNPVSVSQPQEAHGSMAPGTLNTFPSLSVPRSNELSSSMMSSLTPNPVSESLVTQPQERGESRQHEGYIEPNLLKNSLPERTEGREVEGDSGLPDTTRAKTDTSSIAYKKLTLKDEFESTSVKHELYC